MLALLTNDKLWAKDYDEFVQNVSFAADEERIPFASALEAVRRLIARVQKKRLWRRADVLHIARPHVSPFFGATHIGAARLQ